MINDNINEFMNVVEMKAKEFKQHSFEACMNSFLKSVIKQATVVDVSDQLTIDDKKQMIDEVKSTIDSVAKNVINDSNLKDETSALYDVKIAGEIDDPKSFTEKAAKNIADAIIDETDDRCKVLEAKFETGEMKQLQPEEVVEKINESFESISFNNKNNKELGSKMKFLLSVEGEELIESIKSDVLHLVNETEAKNSIVREAISDINERKDQIEEQINGDDSQHDIDKETKSENGVSSDKENDENVEQTSTESFRRHGRNNSHKSIVVIDDLVYTTSANTNNSVESLDIGNSFDRSSFSREEAEQMLKEFRETEDGINTDSLIDDANIFSISENDENKDTTDVDPENKSESESSENDDSEIISIDEEKFNYGSAENPEINPDEIGEETLAKRILPLSLNKVRDNTPVINTTKLACFLTCKEDRGEEFFRCINSRYVMLNDLMSKEGINDDDPINVKIQEILGITNTVKEKVDGLTEDLGILGILDGKYQRTDDASSNAIKSLANGILLSKESLEERKDAEIFKIAMAISDITNDIVNGIDISGNREQLGDLEELLNEKILQIEDVSARQDVESKVKALRSIESVCPLEDILNMQVFVSKDKDKPEKIKLDSLKDIDAYGFCYVDEIQDIEKKIKEKFTDYIKTTDGDHVINFDIHELVTYVAEELDTTKIEQNLYEQIIAKLASNKTIENSKEAFILKNKAKTMVTGLIAADKLGYLSQEDIENIKYDIL